MNAKINRQYVPEHSNYYQQIMQFIDEVKKQDIEMHTIMIYQHESIIFEAAKKPYDIDLPHQSFSMAKSLIATAIGLLHDEQKINIQDRIIDYFPEYSHLTQINQMTVRDALMMATGHSKPMFGTEFRALVRDWLINFLNISYDKKPGEKFLYNSGTSYLLSVLIEKIVGMNVRQYLIDKLFIPLGMDMPCWEQSPEGHSTGGWGLYIKLEDMLKIGILYLNKGIWQGKRILSEKWIDEATSLQIKVDDSLSSFSTRGYGYHFWCGDDDVYRLDGAFGQLCIIDSKADAVIVINGGTPYLQQLRQLAYTRLLPDLREQKSNDMMSVENSSPAYEHSALLSDWSYIDEDTLKNINLAININETYSIVSPPPPTMVESYTHIKLNIDEQKGELVFIKSDGEHRITFGINHYLQSKTSFTTLLHDNYVWDNTLISAVGYWESDKHLHVTCRYLDKVYVDRFSILFNDGNLLIKRSVNVNSLSQKEEELHAIKRM